MTDRLLAEDERTRFTAAVAVLAEAYGRPQQSIVGDIDKPVSFIVRSAFELDPPLEIGDGAE